jgi:predicted SAM-dependent methyltransferase
MSFGSRPHREPQDRTASALAEQPRAERINAYLQAHPVRRLQLGAGKRHINGWLSTDLRPRGAESIYLDVTDTFPFDDRSLDFILGEHIIEHVSWHDGQKMLRECLRTLRPGGVLRLATPDFSRLLSLYQGDAGPDGEHYLRWHHRHYSPADPLHPLVVINHNMRAWGHTFLYDEEMLTSALANAGFIGIVRQDFGQSPHPELCQVEQHGGKAPNRQRAVRWETMCLEGARHAGK